MRLTDEENEYLICLKRGLSSEQMVVELGMTVDEVIEFGDEFFTRVFERIRRSINSSRLRESAETSDIRPVTTLCPQRRPIVQSAPSRQDKAE